MKTELMKFSRITKMYKVEMFYLRNTFNRCHWLISFYPFCGNLQDLRMPGLLLSHCWPIAYTLFKLGKRYENNSHSYLTTFLVLFGLLHLGMKRSLKMTRSFGKNLLFQNSHYIQIRKRWIFPFSATFPQLSFILLLSILNEKLLAIFK